MMLYEELLKFFKSYTPCPIFLFLSPLFYHNSLLLIFYFASNSLFYKLRKIYVNRLDKDSVLFLIIFAFKSLYANTFNDISYSSPHCEKLCTKILNFSHVEYKHRTYLKFEGFDGMNLMLIK